MLRFAIEATCMADVRPTGIGRYAQGLVAGLGQTEGAGSAFDLTVLYRTSRWRRRRQIETVPGVVRRQSWRGAHWPPIKPYALVHTVFERLPRWPGPLKVSTIHDLYAALGINVDDVSAQQRTVDHYRDLAARSDFMLFISEHTRQDFLRLIGFDESRTAVTPLGVDSRFRPQPAAGIASVRSRYGLDAPYLLFVGLTNPNKNLPRLLAAYAQSGAKDRLVLAIVGQVNAQQRAALDPQLAALGIAERVHFTGYVDDADVPSLYAGAEAFLFPSLYEGFGLPILEAMASGVPVLTSEISACPDTAGGHAVLVNPESIDAIANGIDAVLELDSTARDAAQAYAQGCTWQRTAERTLAAYHATLELGRR